MIREESMESRIAFNQQLRDLHQDILRMGALVGEGINKALAAMRNNDSELAAQVIAEDMAIDELHMAIEDEATRIIALEQPVATDLRELITATKIVGDLERIGDHVRHLARAVDRLPAELIAFAMDGITEMARAGTTMMQDALTAFAEQNEEQARAVAARDDMIDRAHRSMYQSLVNLMRERPEWLEYGVELMFLNRFLERLGDHVTNICEWVVFAKTGEHVELNK
jgi:phosphate transport system protein